MEFQPADYSDNRNKLPITSCSCGTPNTILPLTLTVERTNQIRTKHINPPINKPGLKQYQPINRETNKSMIHPSDHPVADHRAIHVGYRWRKPTGYIGRSNRPAKQISYETDQFADQPISARESMSQSVDRPSNRSTIHRTPTHPCVTLSRRWIHR